MTDLVGLYIKETLVIFKFPERRRLPVSCQQLIQDQHINNNNNNNNNSSIKKSYTCNVLYEMEIMGDYGTARACDYGYFVPLNRQVIELYPQVIMYSSVCICLFVSRVILRSKAGLQMQLFLTYLFLICNLH